MTTSKIPNQLIFRHKHNTTELPDNTQPGMVGMICTEMCNNEDLQFVVVGYNNGNIDAIFPRMRVNINGIVEFGQDKLTGSCFLSTLQCTCSPNISGDISVYYYNCHCRVAFKVREEYNKTFEVADPDTEYIVHRFKHFQELEFDYAYQEHITKSMIVDDPICRNGCHENCGVPYLKR